VLGGEQRQAVRRRFAGHPVHVAPAAQRLEDALQEVDEPLPAGVDHVAASQHLELARRLGERRARGHQAAVHHLGEVVLVRASAELVRPRLEHREDGAFARVLQGGVRRLHAAPGRVGELRAVDLPAATHGRREAVQELREDRPRVAVRAVERAVGGHARRGADSLGRGAAEPRGRRLERGRQIGAGVGVAHREHVDAVQNLLLAHDGEGAGAHDTGEHGAVE